MNVAAGLFGALNIDLPKQNRSFGRGSALVFSDVLLILGVGLGLLVVLAGLIYLWSKVGRKRRRHHISSGEKVYRGADKEHEDPDDDVSDSLAVEAEEEQEHGDDPEPGHEHQDDQHNRRRYKYRVRRRSHRTRNPTLSETGGLPPAKTQEPTKPA